MDLAVHSFVGAIPPSRLVVPEGASIDFVRRQIQYRVEGVGSLLLARLPEMMQMMPVLAAALLLDGACRHPSAVPSMVMAARLSQLLQTPLPELHQIHRYPGQTLPLLCLFTGSYAAVDLAAQLSLCVSLQEHSGNLTADAIELQLKDNHNQMVPALSFNGKGGEMNVADYGLVPGPVGTQHHVWAIFVDDTAAKIQREATARILQPSGKAKAVWRCMQVHHVMISWLVGTWCRDAWQIISPGKGIALHLCTRLHR